MTQEDKQDIIRLLEGETIYSVATRRKAKLPASVAYYLLNRLLTHLRKHPTLITKLKDSL